MRLSILTFVLSALALAALAGAAVVKTADGKRYDGNVEFREGKIAVKPHGAPAAILTPDDVASVEFPANAPPKSAEDVPHGLKGEYFLGTDFKTLMFTRLDPQVNFRWNKQPPDPSAPAKDYTVRWTGRFEPRYSEKYKFDFGTHGRARLWIDGKSIFDFWQKDQKNKAGSIELKAGRQYDFKLEFHHDDANAIAVLYWSSHSQPHWIIPIGAFTPPPVPAGQTAPDWMRPDQVQGLTAQYFHKKNLADPAFSRIDRTIDFDWRKQPPATGLGSEFSVRWLGQLEPTLSGSYEFFFDVDDAGRLWVDNKLLADNWKDPRAATLSGKISLQAGRKYPLKLEMANAAGDARAKLSWTGPQFPRQVIPAEHLYLPEGDISLTLASPADGNIFITPAEITLGVQTDLPAGLSIRRLEYLDGAKSLAVTTAAPYIFIWKNPPAGQHALSVRAILSNSKIALSPPVEVLVTDKDPGTVRPPWLVRRIGYASHTALRQNEGVFTIPAGRGRFWAAKDTFQFICQPLHGDGELVARVQALTSSDPNNTAYGGIMIRDALDQGAPFVGAVVNSAGHVVFMHRDKRDDAGELRESPAQLPLWLKVARRGDRVTVSTSPDGKTWTTLDSATPVFDSEDVLAGLVATGLTDAPITATLDHVTLTPGAPPSPTDAAGAQLRSGTFIPGTLKSASADSLILARPNHPDQSLPRDQVARLILRPFPPDLLARIPANTPGVLLPGGDFAAGDLAALDSKHVTVSSLLFGSQSFDLRQGALAICFHDPAPASGFRVITTGQLTYIVPTLTLHRDKLTLTDPALGTRDLTTNDILSIVRIR